MSYEIMVPDWPTKIFTVAWATWWCRRGLNPESPPWKGGVFANSTTAPYSVCDTFPRLPNYGRNFARYMVLLYLYYRLGTSSKCLCSWAVDRISSTIPRGLSKRTLSHSTWRGSPREGSSYVTRIWCPMNDAQLIHYTFWRNLQAPVNVFPDLWDDLN